MMGVWLGGDEGVGRGYARREIMELRYEGAV